MEGIKSEAKLEIDAIEEALADDEDEYLLTIGGAALSFAFCCGCLRVLLDLCRFVVFALTVVVVLLDLELLSPLVISGNLKFIGIW